MMAFVQAATTISSLIKIFLDYYYYACLQVLAEDDDNLMLNAHRSNRMLKIKQKFLLLKMCFVHTEKLRKHF